MSIIHKSLSTTTLLRRLLEMSPKAPLQVVQDHARTIRQTLEQLKIKLHHMNQEYNEVYAQYLREEQRTLNLAVSEARTKLIELETRNGVQQVPVPARNGGEVQVPQEESRAEEVEPAKPPKGKVEKPKKAKEPKPKAAAEPEPPVDVGRLDLRIARIEEVRKHPDADTLYVLKVDCGEAKPRTVCSGLVKQVPVGELENRLVMLLCNLKPVKMRGITSEAMVMCASTADNVEVLIPPENCRPGDLVWCDGFAREPDDVMNPKKKIFEAVAPDLHTNDNLEACYKGVAFSVPGKGNITAKTLKNVPVK